MTCQTASSTFTIGEALLLQVQQEVETGTIPQSSICNLTLMVGTSSRHTIHKKFPFTII